MFPLKTRRCDFFFMVLFIFNVGAAGSFWRMAKLSSCSVFQLVIIRCVPWSIAKRRQWQVVHILRIKLTSRNKTSTFTWQQPSSHSGPPVASADLLSLISRGSCCLCNTWKNAYCCSGLLNSSRCSWWLFWERCYPSPGSLRAQALLLPYMAMPPVGQLLSLEVVLTCP